MIENAENIQEEEIAIEVDSSEEVQPESGDDELERYTKGVSKRINKLNQKTRQAEDRARHFEMLTQQKDAELQKYREMYAQSAQSALDAEEEKLKTQEAQVDDIYRKAVQSSDPDLMSKADTLKNDIAIKKKSCDQRKTGKWSNRNRQLNHNINRLLNSKLNKKCNLAKRPYSGIAKTLGMAIRAKTRMLRPRSMRTSHITISSTKVMNQIPKTTTVN